MNFWEAREAALNGKKVKKIGKPFVHDKSSFGNTGCSWDYQDLQAEWEEVPETIIYYTVPMTPNDAGPCFKSKTNAQNYFIECEGLSVIEFITDKNGKLISARNV